MASTDTHDPVTEHTASGNGWVPSSAMPTVGPRPSRADHADGRVFGTRAGFAASNAATPRAAADALAADLRKRVRGEVRFDAGSRALYSMDASIYRQVPIGVVVPRDADDVQAAVAVCRAHGAPLLPRGCGTSLEGQCCNVAVVLDCSKYMNRVAAIDPEGRRARVQPGTICDDLRDAAEVYQLTFAPDPATHSRATLGGMIGNNSCGVHSVMGGTTAANVETLEILTYGGLRTTVGRTSDDQLARVIAAGGRRGQIYADLKALIDRYGPLVRERYPRIPRRISGYNLDELLPENGFNVARALVGTEDTCATVLEATTRLVYSPPQRVLLVLGYSDAYAAGDHVLEIMAHGPIGFEGFDSRLIEDLKTKGQHTRNIGLLPPGGGWLLIEFGSAQMAEALDKAHALMDDLRRRGAAPEMALLQDPHEQKMVWEIRESGVGASSVIPGKPLTWPNWEDSAVPPERLGDYLRDFRKLLDRFGYDCAFFGHFGQGCIHARIDFVLKTREGIATFRRFMNDAADLVLSYGGSLSGEHGDGQGHAELLPKMFGPELTQAFREFKAIWDPDGKMNPGKLVDAYRMDQNLKLGLDYNPPVVKTHFAFPDDDRHFAHATVRCFGIGKCRRTDGGTMCPSFMATREEKDTTRGRAHMLFEMLQGDPIGGWRSDAVKDSLDLCLSCKGCKGECPVNVDMATYKAEFLAHYYQGRLRPRAAYSMGLIYWWSRLAARMPRLVNFATHAPGLSALFKAAGGIAQQRRIPTYAPETFKRWWARRGARPALRGAPEVVLWPDTFNNHFHPQTAIAAVEVLEAAGYHVVVPDAANPDQTLCCGRPLYDFGMLTLARRQLRQILDRMRPYIRAGAPIVVLEPSCCSVFRDELLNLFPDDQDATRLSQQTFLLSEFLERTVGAYELPRLRRQAVVHGHCHHKAVLKFDDEAAVLEKLGLDYDILDSGCCGMAGSFGFEPGEKYDVSVKCGERVLVPKVDAAPKDALIVADGFSCREQIEQLTDRRPLHLAEVVQLALRVGAATPADDYPEHRANQSSNGHGDGSGGALSTATKVALVSAGAVLTGAALIWGRSLRR